jgi:hypothetical protein
MLQSYSLAAAICRTFLAVLGWVSLVFQFFLAQAGGHALGQTTVFTTANFFSYFTITTNLLVAFSLSAAQLNPRSRFGAFFSKSSVQTAIAGNILVVALIYNVVLAKLSNLTGSAWLVDFLLHSTIPVLYMVYWLLFVPKGVLSLWAPLVWLLYPLAYVLYSMTRGAIVGWYPYPFVDVGDLGYTMVLFNSVKILAVFLVIFYGLALVDKALGHKVPKAVITA